MARGDDGREHAPLLAYSIMSNIELEKSYDPAEHEPSLYQAWLESGYFNPDNLPTQGKPYTIMMPPPNATGVLHAGHALFLTIQDILIRYQRMQGRKTLWLPGTDHAAIATQSRVEKDIVKQEGKNRHDLGREELLRRIDEFVAKHRTIMTTQMRAMGASCDWSREAFTLDADRNRAVVEAFRRLYDMGLIYRGHRIVNWDPKGQTTISDDEITHEERTAKLYTFRYSKDFPIAIATTRPETKVGDTAVAVHPDDARYAQYVGQTFNVTFCDVPLTIKVIADEAVDPAFGTGALGVTPAHSTIDWDMAQRHNLPVSPVINEYARMTVPGMLSDLKVTDARASVVAWITEQGLMEKEEDTIQNVATAERTGGIVEPLPKLQWFIGVNKPFVLPHSEIDGIVSGQTVTLKQLMQHVVQAQQIRMVPERYVDTYFQWIDNLRDWCISRQIWYGHRIPVWYKGDEISVSGTSPGVDWTQDEDTLDTWFSSGIWTFSTLGWPKTTPDLSQYHPTDVLETAYEIIFFWVARMILMSTSLVGQIPFRTVFFHGLVRDEKRQKLSKSKADSANPLDLIAQFGADALRMGLIFNTSPGTDSVLSEQKIRGMKHFGNKLWNIARYVLMNVPAEDISTYATTRPSPTTDADKLIVKQLDALVASITANIDRFALHEAAQEAYQFAWHEFADIYLEASKDQLLDEATAQQTRHILVWALVTILKLLHPFTPFVTEALWARILPQEKLLMVASWPACAMPAHAGSGPRPSDSVVH